jgi:hypothetical protein
MTLMTAALQAFLLAFPALFSIVNPLGGSIIFHEVTVAQTHAERVVLARRVAIYSTIVMVVALWLGSYILNFFGISMNALRIAGGIVVSVRAYEMLSAPEANVQRKEAEAAPVERHADFAVHHGAGDNCGGGFAGHGAAGRDGADADFLCRRHRGCFVDGAADLGILYHGGLAGEGARHIRPQRGLPHRGVSTVGNWRADRAVGADSGFACGDAGIVCRIG